MKFWGGYLHEYLFSQGFNGDYRALNEDKVISTLHKRGSNPSIPPPFAPMGSHYKGLVESSSKYNQ